MTQEKVTLDLETYEALKSDIRKLNKENKKLEEGYRLNFSLFGNTIYTKDESQEDLIKTANNIDSINQKLEAKITTLSKKLNILRKDNNLYYTFFIIAAIGDLLLLLYLIF